MNITARSVFLTSLLVSSFLLLIGSLGKTLIAMEFRWSNFYLGPEFSLAAISAGLLNFLDMLNAKEVGEVFWRVISTIAYLAVTFGIYMLVLCMHQNIEKRQTSPQRRGSAVKWMGLLANFTGLLPNFAFAWLKLKGQL